MDSSPYQNREIDEKFEEIRGALTRIEVQTTKTNGTVRWLEKLVWLSMGFCSCVTIILLPLLYELISSGKL